LPSNQRFGKIAEEWKKRKEEKAGVAPAPAPAVVNNFMKVEEVSPPSTDKEEEPKEQPKSPSEEPDEEAVEEPQMPLKKNKKTLPPIKIPANKV